MPPHSVGLISPSSLPADFLPLLHVHIWYKKKKILNIRKFEAKYKDISIPPIQQISNFILFFWIIRIICLKFANTATIVWKLLSPVLSMNIGNSVKRTCHASSARFWTQVWVLDQVKIASECWQMGIVGAGKYFNSSSSVPRIVFRGLPWNLKWYINGQVQRSKS